MKALKNILSFAKKYGLFLCIPLFLGAAYYYTIVTYPQYKVSAKVTLQDAAAASVANAIKSKPLVQKVISQLPLAAKFYNIKSPKNELYGDSVPVKFVFGGDNKINTETQLELSISNDDQFTLSNNDTVSYHKFNEPNSEYYGKFIVIKKPAFKSYDKTFIVKLDEPGQVLDQFYDKLHVEPGTTNNEVTVSVLTGNSQKGVDFLNRLLRLYAASNPGTATVAVTAPAPVADDESQMDDNISILKGRASALEREINRLKDKSKVVKTRVVTRKPAVDETQRKIYEAIKPYVKKPIDQFVQIPYVDEIENPDLNDEVNEYNETELAKRHLVAQGNSAQIDTVNRKLMMLRSDIFEKISGSASSRDSYTVSSPDNASIVRIRIKEDSLSQLNKKIEAETRKYAAIKATPVKPQLVAAGPRFAIIEKPEDSIEYLPVNELMIYGMALLASAVVLFAWWLTRKLSKKTTSYPSLDPKNISEKINSLFAEKQID